MNEKDQDEFSMRINGLVTVQFCDGDEKKIIKGDVVEDQAGHIIVECERTKYWINKNKVDWIKFDSI